MKVAVMQPYLFPYIGYFQLIKAVDKFVFYDDVNFIKQGWINRNRILVSNQDFLFTVPLQKANSFNLIKNTMINSEFYNNWVNKFVRTVDQSYNKAPFYKNIKPIIFEVFRRNNNTISDLAIDSIITISKYLGLKTEFHISSLRYDNKDLDRQERLIDICKKENATHYINAIGGKELYTKESFKEKGIELSFINSSPISYKQFDNEFIPWLSIIDVLMFNSVEEINMMLNKYEIVR